MTTDLHTLVLIICLYAYFTLYYCNRANCDARYFHT